MFVRPVVCEIMLHLQFFTGLSICTSESNPC